MPDADPRITRARADIQTHGWHVLKVMADESGPAFAYSIGLYETFKHPEVLLFGFEFDLMHVIINNIGFEVRNGMSFRPDQRDEGVLDDYEVEFKAVLPKFLDELVGTALDYYGGPVFTVLQCVLPDKAHRFPWDPECN
jgi:hypothetical protein